MTAEEEVKRVLRENAVKPSGGCLPMLLAGILLAATLLRPAGAAAQAEPPTLSYVSGPLIWQEYNGEWRTSYTYRLQGAPGVPVAVRFWVDAPGVYGVMGWPAWQRGADAAGAYVELNSVPLPNNGALFSLVFSGIREQTARVPWRIATAGQLIADTTWGSAAPPHTLPATGRLYLPLVLR
jgi:hypothetical protein